MSVKCENKTTTPQPMSISCSESQNQHQANVFSYGGNPLGIITDSSDWNTNSWQQLKKNNNSELT